MTSSLMGQLFKKCSDLQPGDLSEILDFVLSRCHRRRGASVSFAGSVHVTDGLGNFHVTDGVVVADRLHSCTIVYNRGSSAWELLTLSIDMSMGRL